MRSYTEYHGKHPYNMAGLAVSGTWMMMMITATRAKAAVAHKRQRLQSLGPAGRGQVRARTRPR